MSTPDQAPARRPRGLILLGVSVLASLIALLILEFRSNLPGSGIAPAPSVITDQAYLGDTADDSTTPSAQAARALSTTQPTDTAWHHLRLVLLTALVLLTGWFCLRLLRGDDLQPDLADYRRSKLLLDGRNRVLEMLAKGAPLTQMLRAIVEYIERISPQSLCSIHLYDPATQTLRNGAALRLPAHYLQAVDGVPTGRGVGSCGHAATIGERVIVADILNHPFWSAFRELMLQTDLRACWSQPILAHDGQVLGTFAIYANRVMEPGAAEIELIESAASLAAIVIEHARAELAKREAEERARLLLDATTQGVFGLDLDGRTSFVNPAAARLLGYSTEALTGRQIHDLIHIPCPSPDTSGADAAAQQGCPLRDAARDGRAYHMAAATFRRCDGSSFPVEYWATPVRRDGEVVGAVVTFHDITERQRAAAEIQHLAFHDALTDLPNRLLLMEEMNLAMGALARTGQRFALHLLDLDHFKDINDTLGHPVGDALLCAVAERISNILRESDLFVRFGGDELALLQRPVQEDSEAAVLAAKITDAMATPFDLSGHRLRVTASIGITIADSALVGIDELVARADVALYKAKEAGRATYAFFEDAMTLQLRRELAIAQELAEAIARNQLLVAYQPQWDLHEERIVGMEALVRWDHPQRGLLLPADFLPAAEKRGLIRGISDWVLETACAQTRRWHDAGLYRGRIAVNLSAQQLADEDFAGHTLAVLRRAGLRPDQLELELSETVLIQCKARAHADIQRLAELGVRFAIDDFGSGFSSLRHLQVLHADTIKIDREFVAGATQNPRDAAIVKAIIGLGGALDLTISAEGVEQLEQAQFLLRHGCRLVQGYLYAHPVTADEVEARWLRGASPAALTANASD